MNKSTTRIEMTCEAAPLQFEGEIDGNPFYFRARWESWRFTIVRPGGNPVSPKSNGEVLYAASGKVATGPFSASYLDPDLGLRMIATFIMDFRSGGTGNALDS